MTRLTLSAHTATTVGSAVQPLALRFTNRLALPVLTALEFAAETALSSATVRTTLLTVTLWRTGSRAPQRSSARAGCGKLLLHAIVPGGGLLPSAGEPQGSTIDNNFVPFVAIEQLVVNTATHETDTAARLVADSTFASRPFVTFSARAETTVAAALLTIALGITDVDALAVLGAGPSGLAVAATAATTISATLLAVAIRRRPTPTALVHTFGNAIVVP